MRNLIATMLCLVTLPVAAGNQPAGSLWGAWKVSISTDPTYTGVMIIDRAGRAMYEDQWDPNYRRPRGLKPIEPGNTKSFGYVRALGRDEFNIVTTNREGVAHWYCTLLSADLIKCDKGITTGTRVGPGPENLMPASR